MKTLEHSPFKAYDLRGRVPESLNSERAQAIGRAYARIIGPTGPVVIGRDMRLSSPELAQALTEGLNQAGTDTIDIGLCGTELVYHAASRPGMGGGIMITASHNPADYNGMKMVREQAIPISADTGLKDIEHAVAEGLPAADVEAGTTGQEDVLDQYVARMLGQIEADRLRPLKVVVNAGNGCAGPAFDAIARHLPLQISRLHHQPDGHFPNGVPNPLLPENRAETSQAVRQADADFGIAWDGDFDRCFFFDEDGRFIEGYYLVGLFAATLLEKQPGGKIVLDPRLIWNTLDQVQQAGGVPLINKSGHAFIKERMRAEDALYGGEMSAHHYFRDFSFCDSGMLPWLLLAETLSTTGRSLGELVDERIRAYPCSGEINFSVPDAGQALQTIFDAYRQEDPVIDRTDGISMDFGNWRFNLRASNTEPVIRLNVETRGDQALLEDRVGELTRRIEQL
ncbi:phosphomannomutase/phosphoglucomutase [Wenzhouxiangella marina]|uniref:phosphomannomutase n=1 Tax=Wenzhouxiangella marina TaxID=1579979 RepID=A0A0K0XY40_9GAMM|nr:phosphomannomutase/phosphoglucomutase [Wenzhouxiangella marina]AKS42614.1 phosphomannomutase [Wenzhouxiangella marina]MBB6085604.1 phosphomannomutase/phosphomannomutase/phosphoglucomutase [Wenzhouxiangella marina]